VTTKTSPRRQARERSVRSRQSRTVRCGTSSFRMPNGICMCHRKGLLRLYGGTVGATNASRAMGSVCQRDYFGGVNLQSTAARRSSSLRCIGNLGRPTAHLPRSFLDLCPIMHVSTNRTMRPRSQIPAVRSNSFPFTAQQSCTLWLTCRATNGVVRSRGAPRKERRGG
jgi:hypothetical protein